MNTDTHRSFDTIPTHFSHYRPAILSKVRKEMNGTLCKSIAIVLIRNSQNGAILVCSKIVRTSSSVDLQKKVRTCLLVALHRTIHENLVCIRCCYEQKSFFGTDCNIFDIGVVAGEIDREVCDCGRKLTVVNDGYERPSFTLSVDIALVWIISKVLDGTHSKAKSFPYFVGGLRRIRSQIRSIRNKQAILENQILQVITVDIIRAKRQRRCLTE